MRTVTLCACATILSALALVIAGAASAYVPEDEPLERGGATAGPNIPAMRLEDEPPFAPADPDSGVQDDFGPIDHSTGGEATSVPEPRAALADIAYGDNGLPEAVAKVRADLLEAARTGDIEALRPIFERQRIPPIVDTFDTTGDPIEVLRLQSGDPEGREILAILSEILETGHVRIGEKSTTTYVWPYFAEVPLNVLTPTHYVELYRVLTAVDVEEMARLKRYTFFRVGIAPDGRVRYLSAGDIE